MVMQPFTMLSKRSFPLIGHYISQPICFVRSLSQKQQGSSTRYEDSIATRIVPKLPTFYSANPIHENYIDRLDSLIRKYIKLPSQSQLANQNPQLSSSPHAKFQQLSSSQSNLRPLWLSFQDYLSLCGGSRLRPTQYAELLLRLNKLHSIDSQLTNEEIKSELSHFYRKSSTQAGTTRLPTLDEFGRSVGIGRRKSASAKVYVVRGTGEILVNNRPLNDYFVKLKDRESIMYPLQVIQSVGKYNVFAMTSGGGPTGQAEAIMLAIGKALVAFNPLLKSRLHKAGVLTTDIRRVERKKPGRVKARKMPTWVKR